MEDPKASEEGKAMEDLKLLVMQALSANGSLDVIRAQLRSTVFAAIQSKQTNHNAEAAKAIASPPGEAAAALFVDFARALGLQHSLDVFPSECQFAPGAAQPVVRAGLRSGRGRPTRVGRLPGNCADRD